MRADRAWGRSLAMAGVMSWSLVAPSPVAEQGPGPPPRWVLVYAGAPARYTKYPRYTLDDWTRLVAVVDTTGRAKSWLTTGAILVNLYAPSTRVFTNWIGGAAATGDDWRDYLDSVFAAGGPIARLDSAVASVGQAVGALKNRYRLAVMIPYPDQKVDSLVYGGRTYHLRVARDGAALAQAYVHDAATRFDARHYRTLALDAFYWLHESIEGSDTAVVPAVAATVHKAGFRFLWIPYFTAPGYAVWRQLGFDEAWLQPNYFFTPGLPATRVDSALVIARRFAMGTELEFDPRLFTSPQYGDRLITYLSRLGAAPDFRARSITIYEGAGGLLELSRSRDPWHRAIYDRLVRVLQSTDSSLAPD